MSRCFRFFISLLFFLPLFSFGLIYPGGTPLSDNNYFIYKTPRYIIIFDKQYKKSIVSLHQYVDYYFNHVQKTQNRNLDEPIVLVFLSSQSQVANALASLFPFFQNIYYSSGLKDTMASPFWLDTVLTHELTHVYQLSHSVFPKFLRKVFKSPSGLILKIFFNMYPNQTLPRIFLEGDAVLKESMIGKGGRLYSGFARAFVFSQIKHYKNASSLLAKKLINETIYPHGGIDKYLHGGYLSLYLSQKYSHKTLTDFFKANSQNDAMSSFKLSFFHSGALFRQFKVTFDSMIRMYINQYQSSASLQRTSSRETLFESASCLPFNSKQNKVFFFTTNALSSSYVRIYNKRSKKWIHRKTTLLPGKLFKIGKSYYSRTSYPNSFKSIVYSLFSKNAISHKFFNSKYVEDIKGNSILYIDSKNTLEGRKLFLNNRFYSYIHSNALFDSHKNIFYFKQKNSLRTLYKNKIPIFSYYGFYGQIIDIDSSGTVYFTASTPYGSSIFQYKNGIVQRTVMSDTVIHAKKINSEEFLVCEITPTAYAYKVIPIEEKMESPAFYEYTFDKRPQPPKPYYKFDKVKINSTQKDTDDLFDDLDKHWDAHPQNIERTLTSKKNKKTTHLKYKKYNSLTNIKYSSMNQMLLFQSLHSFDFKYYIEFIFTDYLQKNSILLKYLNSNVTDMLITLIYQNQLQRPIWSVGYNLSILNKKKSRPQPEFTMDDSPFSNILYFIETSNIHHSSFINLAFPLFKIGYWSSNFKSKIDTVITSSNNKKTKLENDGYTAKLQQPNLLLTGVRGSLNLNYSRHFSLAPLPHRLWSVNLFADYVQGVNTDFNDLKWGAHSQWAAHLGFQFYLMTSLGYAQSMHIKNIYINMQPDHWPLHTGIGMSYLPINSVQFNIGSLTHFSAKRVQLASLSLTKPIYTPLFTKYILSLIYLTPFIIGNYYILNDFSIKERGKNPLPSVKQAHFIEWTAGLEIQLLLDYKKPFQIILSGGQRIPASLFQFQNSYKDSGFNLYLQSKF